jgi:hypothetical protein
MNKDEENVSKDNEKLLLKNNIEKGKIKFNRRKRDRGKQSR